MAYQAYNNALLVLTPSSEADLADTRYRWKLLANTDTDEYMIMNVATGGAISRDTGTPGLYTWVNGIPQDAWVSTPNFFKFKIEKSYSSPGAFKFKMVGYPGYSYLTVSDMHAYVTNDAWLNPGDVEVNNMPILFHIYPQTDGTVLINSVYGPFLFNDHVAESVPWYKKVLDSLSDVGSFFQNIGTFFTGVAGDVLE